MKKLIALLLSAVMVLSLAACSSSKPSTTTPDNSQGSSSTSTDNNTAPAADSNFKVGVVLVGDENEGYTYAHIDGIKKAAAANGLKDDQIVWFYSIGEDETCYDKCIDCVEQGCKLVITNSYGHQTYCEQAAKENPNVQFVAMTGDTALKSGLSNFSNAFNQTYQSRYVSGIVAGMKVKELLDNGKLSDKNYDANGNIKIGYVGAYPYAEVVSGYTGFYLGIKSIVPNVAMEVSYTNSWFDITAEQTTAEMLIADGCVIIGQHADSTGAPTACENANKAGTVVYSVGYNVDMLSVAPTAALTSSTNDWSVYYNYAIKTALAGGDIATDWSEGYETGAVGITTLGSSCAAGTKEAVDKAEADIKAGTLHVFDINTFTVGGQKITSTFCFDSDGDFVYDQVEAIKDGYYDESKYISAPSFSLRIDGITEMN
ncbi:MAG: BMP family ABC transporter substrate-binding protein [Lachnospiraceae bacterium]|nr:BMP family ABC transporter substrate-binding protein [Lachnospiraceae bacterium]